jgi:(p)ppGpp synthase/HD superfamily hydrolase
MSTVQTWDNLYATAFHLAKKAHDGARRKYTDEPYFLHPLRVSEGTRDIRLKIVALLHDVLEDTPKYTSEIKLKFPECIFELLDAVTRQHGETYDEFIDRIKYHKNPDARVIKILDIKDNLSKLPEGDKLQKRYLKALEELTNV